MLISSENALKRLNHSSNLANGSRGKAMGLFGIGSVKTEVKEAIVAEDIPIAFNDSPDKPASLTPFNPFANYIKEVEEEISASPKAESITVNDLVPNADEEISLATAESSAAALLNEAIVTLRNNLDNIHPSKLPSVIQAASKTVESIRKERNESKKSNREQDVHYHFYVPEQRKIADYAVVEVA